MTNTAENSLSPGGRWGIVALLMGFAALAHFNRVGIAVAGSEVFIKQLEISEPQMGWVYTTFLIVYTIGMLPGGWLIDRVGSVPALTLLGLSMGMFVALTGTLGWLAATPLGLWLGLMVLRGLAGGCSAPLHPGAAHVVSELMPRRQRATANGMVTAGALLGIACCYPAFGWLIDRMGWPAAFVVSGSALVVYGGLWRALAGSALSSYRPPSHGKPAAVKPANKAKGTQDRALLKNKNLWLLALSYGAYGYFQYLFFYWMNHYFSQVLHVSEAGSRLAVFYIMLAQGAGMAIGGMATDVACNVLDVAAGRRSVVVVGMGLGALFGLMGVWGTDPGSVTVWLALSMGALGMCEGVFWTTATDLGGSSRGFAGAFMNTWGNVGGLISPTLSPLMAQTMGWPGVIAVACVISAIGGLLWFLIRLDFSPRPNDPPDKPAGF